MSSHFLISSLNRGFARQFRCPASSISITVFSNLSQRRDETLCWVAISHDDQYWNSNGLKFLLGDGQFPKAVSARGRCLTSCPIRHLPPDLAPPNPQVMSSRRLYFETRSPKGARRSYLFSHVVYMMPLAPGVLRNASSQPLGLSRLSAS